MPAEPFRILTWSDEPSAPPELTPREAQLANALSDVAQELSDIHRKNDALATPALGDALRLLRSIGRRNWTAHLR